MRPSHVKNVLSITGIAGGGVKSCFGRNGLADNSRLLSDFIETTIFSARIYILKCSNVVAVIAPPPACCGSLRRAGQGRKEQRGAMKA